MDRSTIAVAGVVLLVVLAGCTAVPFFGDDTEDLDDPAPSDDLPEGENTEATPDAGAAGDFDFPAGADDTQAEPQALVSNARDVLADSPRYTVRQEHTVEYRDERTVETEDGQRLAYEVVETDAIELKQNVSQDGIHEQRIQEGVEIERWITPERAVARSAELDGDRTSKWIADTTRPGTETQRGFHLDPFEQTTAPDLLKSASFEFDGVVTENDQEYAQYSGDVTFSEAIEPRDFDSVDSKYDVESVSEGTVTVRISETGAIHSIEYQLIGDLVRLAPDGHDTMNANVTGEIHLEYGDLPQPEPPEWAESPPEDEFLEFEVVELSSGAAYQMTSETSVPGSMGVDNARFFVSAEFGDEKYVDTYTNPTDFESDDVLYAGLITEKDEFVAFRSPVDGKNAFEEADRVEVSIYLWSPEDPKIPIYYEEHYPAA